MNYSGRTTAYKHKRDDWQKHKGPFPPALTQKTIFNVQWTDCPVEVEDEVRKLWRDNELGNHEYYPWKADEEVHNDAEDDEITLAKKYPIINAYLESKGVNECLIHWWW